jgi:hypothetical protein
MKYGEYQIQRLYHSDMCIDTRYFFSSSKEKKQKQREIIYDINILYDLDFVRHARRVHPTLLLFVHCIAHVV